MVFVLAFVRSSPATIAKFLRRLVPLLAVLAGAGLILGGRISFGLPMIALGIMWWLRSRNVRPLNTPNGQTSTVRSAWLEMHLDHDTGDLDGLVLAGNQEGSSLSDLSFEELSNLYDELKQDDESRALLEAYLDRSSSGWRDSADTGPSDGNRGSSGSGPMTKEEAYQVLGLETGASSNQIRAAHRKLMKAVHPDSGGSTFLAARINQAKDTLLD